MSRQFSINESNRDIYQAGKLAKHNYVINVTDFLNWNLILWENKIINESFTKVK